MGVMGAYSWLSGETHMSWQQFGFFAGFLFVALWSLAGVGAALGALIVGLICFYIGRVLDGDVNVGEIVERFTPSNGRPR